MPAVRTIVWFRGKDLRLRDHAPLRSALDAGEVIPLFVLDPYFFSPTRARNFPHRMQFLLDSLTSLQESIAALGSRLLLVEGKSVDVVPRLADQWRADRVVAHRWSEPFAVARDSRIGRALGERFVLFEGETLVPPGSIRTAAGTAYSVFTPFRNAFTKHARIGPARAAPRRLPALPIAIPTHSAPVPTLAELGLTRNERLIRGGERAARQRLASFVKRRLGAYGDTRDRMDLDGTSRLSADLKFGTLSVRDVWNTALAAAGLAASTQAFLDELLWREFGLHTLVERPEILTRPFDNAFEGFPYLGAEEHWHAWVEGRTGYPIVDASARQLLREGFVHNRARMIAASFLIKHLLIDPRRGEEHYLSVLVDGDWSSNNLGWQWSAGSGVSAAPYFRVFNPVAQGEKLDPEGAYVRRYVPELASLPTKFIHRPWDAPAATMRSVNVCLGKTYPMPIVDLDVARARYLAVAREHLSSRASGIAQEQG